MREKKKGTPLNYFSLRSSYLCDFILNSGCYNNIFTSITCNKLEKQKQKTYHEIIYLPLTFFYPTFNMGKVHKARKFMHF